MTFPGRMRRLVSSVVDREHARREALREVRRLRADAKRARDERNRQERAALSQDGALETVALDYPRHEVRLLVSSRMEREWRAKACAREPWTVAWLEEAMDRPGVLYDIGANVGAFTLIAAKLAAGEGRRVVAFEPGYASFARLCDNIVLNGVQDRVFPIPLALGERVGVATLSYNTLQPGQSRHGFVEGMVPVRGDGSQYSQPMLALSLDAAVEQFHLPPPNHLKIDVDGTELNVLRGAAKTLADAGLRSLLIEIDESRSESAVTLLRRRGFTLESRHARKSDTGNWYGVFQRKG